MYSLLFNIVNKSTNYNIVNVNNLFNFLILSIDLIKEEQKERFFTNLRVCLGLTLYEHFKKYCILKNIDDKIYKYL